jgi:hypothetical protein
MVEALMGNQAATSLARNETPGRDSRRDRVRAWLSRCKEYLLLQLLNLLEPGRPSHS